MSINLSGPKKKPNSTAGMVDEKQVVFEYAAPADVPNLMKEWFTLCHQLMASVVPGDREKLVLMTWPNITIPWGKLNRGKKLLVGSKALNKVAAFCEQAWKASMVLVEKTHRIQENSIGK